MPLQESKHKSRAVMKGVQRPASKWAACHSAAQELTALPPPPPKQAECAPGQKCSSALAFPEPIRR
eukprot:1148299-Pelagomonas_calceolata.AAC.1